MGWMEAPSNIVPNTLPTQGPSQSAMSSSPNNIFPNTSYKTAPSQGGMSSKTLPSSPPNLAPNLGPSQGGMSANPPQPKMSSSPTNTEMKGSPSNIVPKLGTANGGTGEEAKTKEKPKQESTLLIQAGGMKKPLTAYQFAMTIGITTFFILILL